MGGREAQVVFFVKMDRGGVLTYGKRRSMCVLSILKFACAFEQANQSLFFYDGPNGSFFISILFHNSEFRILNSEFRNLHCEFRNSEL